MMKKIFIVQIFLVLVFLSESFAQSDFRVTQEFKSKQRSFEIAIEYAKSITELEKINREISEFRSEYRGSKDLLNRALYPENFESSFKVLNKKIRYTNKKLDEITKLNRNVSKLETENFNLTKELRLLIQEVSALRSRNSTLMMKLKTFKNGYGGSKNSIDSLNSLITDLRNGISERDALIKEIMDNIFMTADHNVESLDKKQLNGLKGKIQNTSLIENIRSLVDDNVNFLNSGTLDSKNLAELRSEFNDFDSRWNHFGPKLFSIYAKDKTNNEKLLEIDSLISGWDNTLNLAIWNSINRLFADYDIKLQNFTNGNEFEKIVVDYIDNKISNTSSNEIAKDQKYIFFAQRVWDDKIKKNWLPLLLNNNLLSTQQKNKIEIKIKEWEVNIGSSKSYLVYGIIALLGLLILGSLFFITKRKKNRLGSTSNPLLNEDDVLTTKQDSLNEDKVDNPE